MSEIETPSILEKMGLGQALPEIEDESFQDDDQYRAFGISRKVTGGEPMLDLVSREGDHQGFAYNHIYRITFDPSKAIQLFLTDHEIRIHGQQLHDLYKYLLMHRVIFIAEADSATQSLLTMNEPLVSKLVVKEANR